MLQQDASGTLEALAPLLAEIERRLLSSLESARDRNGARPPEKLAEAMGYMLLAGGKRLRPLLVLESAHAVAHDDDRARARELAFPAAIAVEYVHTYSLIHDDLPALDDDDLRRGRPTLHVKYDEATAILAGDSLLTDAFGFVAQAERNGAEQCLELARAAGSAGMVGGQWEDIGNEGQSGAVLADTLEAIHRRKTGRLFVASCALGAHAVGATAAVVEKLSAYGASFGLAFQIADDVLDVVGAVEERGKRQGGDVAHEKLTYVRAYGLEGARRRALDEADKAAALASSFGPHAESLVRLARFAAERTR